MPADETKKEEAPAQAPEKKAEEPKVEAKPEKKAEEIKVEKKEESKEDPTLSRLIAAERQIEELKSSLEAERGKVKTFEREGRKTAILSAAADAFPGLPRDEIRGAALVAAEDGTIDLFSQDTKAQVDALKGILAGKKKQAPPAPSLGGSPGAPAKPQVSGKDGLRWRV
ncbi:hypothetical protein [Nannocystis pusilla]|uniref:hypothetical protein n=1 Tax=Nannocystis pusilla TaxID=889268 RepID=UPI003DA2A51D